MYHGWQDAAIPPGNTIDYYAARGREFACRLIGARCSWRRACRDCLAGPGPNIFDALGTLDAWRQGGPAPERIVATKFDDDLFAYLGLPAKAGRRARSAPFPGRAKWDGKGSTDDEVSFTCAAPGT